MPGAILDIPRPMLPEVNTSSSIFGETVVPGDLPVGDPVAGIAGNRRAAPHGQCFLGARHSGTGGSAPEGHSMAPAPGHFQVAQESCSPDREPGDLARDETTDHRAGQKTEVRRYSRAAAPTLPSSPGVRSSKSRMRP